MTTTTITTQAALRDAFWQEHPGLVMRLNRRGRPLPQNHQPCDTRCAWVDYVDSMAREGAISQGLARRATL